MPEMVRPSLEKNGDCLPESTAVFFSGEPDHLRDLRHLRSPDEPWRELAAVLATGYLRLTQRSRNDAVSRPGEPQKPLDLPRKPRPHVQGHGSP